MNENVALVVRSPTVLSVVIQLPPYRWRMPLGTVRLRTGCVIAALRYARNHFGRRNGSLEDEASQFNT